MKGTILVILFFAGIIGTAVWGVADEAKRSKIAGDRRTEFCTYVCAEHDGMYKWRRQQIGFGSHEYRCFCANGHWQVVP